MIDRRQRRLGTVTGCLFAAIGVFTWTAVGEVLAQAPFPAGTDFLVHDLNGTDDLYPNVANVGGDTYLVVWRADEPIGFLEVETRIRGQRVDGDGVFVGSQFEIVQDSVELIAPTVESNGSAAFVVAWERFDSNPFDPSVEIFVRQYDAAGDPVGAPLLVNSYTTVANDLVPMIGSSSVAHAPDGSAVVVWRDAERDGASGGGIIARRVSPAGALAGAEFRVNSDTARAVIEPAVSMDGSGNYVIVWKYDDGTRQVAARRFDSNDVPLGTEFVVDAVDTFGPEGPAVDHDAAGGFVIAFNDFLERPFRIRAQRYDSSGASLGTPVTVPDEDTFPLTSNIEGGAPKLFVAADGRFTVTFQTLDMTFARSFDASGNPVGPAYHLMDRLFNAIVEESIAGNPTTGSFLAVREQRGDGIGVDIFARRFCDPAQLGCDICTGYDDLLDADADSVPDGCDPCTNLSAERDSYRGTFKVKRPNSQAGRDTLKVSMEFDLAGPFAALDPENEGVRLRIEDQPLVGIETSTRNALLDVRLPAGAFAGNGSAGWTLSANGRVWKYTDKRTGVTKYFKKATDIGKVVVKQTSTSDPNRVKVKLSGRGGFYGFSFPPLVAGRMSFAIGDTSAASAGLCGEAEFFEGECSIKPGNQLPLHSQSADRVNCAFKRP